MTTITDETMPQREAADILDTAKKLITRDRNEDYGEAIDDFTRTAKMWEQILGIEISAEQFAQCMIVVKLSRLAHTPNHDDSWVDIAGYAALGGSIAAVPGRHG
ncbi:DUF6378 domain-containing protein [Mycolicibacillus koreensis]|nr:DUF6378 domain-containing protein [Mycolicibacillus koreensis]